MCKDLDECLVQYLKDKGVENEKAEQAVLKTWKCPKGKFVMLSILVDLS